MKIQKWYSLSVILVLLCFGIPNKTIAQYQTIKNDIFWNTKDGKPLNSQGGGIFKFPDPKTGKQKYYWYGVEYVEANQYRADPSITLPNATFEAVTCYSSTDFVNWTFEKNVLTKDKVNQNGKTWVGRLGVAFVKEISKYAMFVQHGSEVLIALSDSPTGEFIWHQKINMEKMIGTSNTGDQTVFTDEDTGKSYLIYSYGRGRNKIYVSEIGMKDGKVNLLDCTEIFKGESREGNCMFKYKNSYYMYASNIYGWDGSFAYYLVADDIRGPYLPTNEMLVTNGSSEDFAHVSQTGFFFSVKGSKQETIVFCGDRWSDFAGNGLGYNQWCPLSFDGKTPYFNSLSAWELDAKTGNWKVNKENNYVKNGSFEADRRHIPSPVKPVQIQLTGWASEVIEGNKISLDTLTSPVLNHFNTQYERKIVIGEKSLNISDKINFKRKVFQSITSSPYVKLEDGSYTLTAKIKNSAGFDNLEVYAESNNKKFQFAIKEENTEWKTIVINNIAIKGGKAEVGFLADGKAKSFCLVDDVSLVRSGK
ncbi:family 43 glycosylhydrolase [Flavobacterium sp. LHD-80]|uniref:family 43 glycosylhydrolase n=1 Tax=Flavobacterium sp. LHD-80 TaxID=3071411 RepID=UPI0027E0C824|nr:family 43 glycosylhydrolase [Flavobacterium sp. LHD-80]MDQ6470841.1 family 43 glycosylhydrolase [Flavobacterium sp. LHD-80]